MVLNIYSLNGQFPEMVVRGETADISELAEFAWYDWVMFWDKTLKFPNNKLAVVNYLVPSEDVGTDMCANILESNVQKVFRCT